VDAPNSFHHATTEFWPTPGLAHWCWTYEAGALNELGSHLHEVRANLPEFTPVNGMLEVADGLEITQRNAIADPFTVVKVWADILRHGEGWFLR